MQSGPDNRKTDVPKNGRTDQKYLVFHLPKKRIKEGKSVDNLPSFFYSIICESFICSTRIMKKRNEVGEKTDIYF